MKTAFVEIDHLNHLDQVTPFMDLRVKRGKNDTFNKAQLKYFTLVLVMHSRPLNTK